MHIRLFLILILALQINAFAQTQTATAKKGDGIHTLLSRHEINTAEMRQEFITLNKEQLGKQNHLIAGKTYLLPDKKSTSKKSKGKFPIFGNKYANIIAKGSE